MDARFRAGGVACPHAGFCHLNGRIVTTDARVFPFGCSRLRPPLPRHRFQIGPDRAAGRDSNPLALVCSHILRDRVGCNGCPAFAPPSFVRQFARTRAASHCLSD